MMFKSHLINRGEWPYDPLYQRNRDCPTCVKYSLFLPNFTLTNSSAVVIVAREPHGRKCLPQSRCQSRSVHGDQSQPCWRAAPVYTVIGHRGRALIDKTIIQKFLNT